MWSQQWEDYAQASWIDEQKATFLVRSTNALIRRQTHPKETPYFDSLAQFTPRVWRAYHNTSLICVGMAAKIAVGNHARIFVDLRLCGDRSACRVLTPFLPRPRQY